MAKNVIIVAHKFLTQPDDDLVIYLNTKSDNVLHIRHSFADAPDRASFFDWYQRGQLHKSFRSKDYKASCEPFIYLKELYFTIKWTLSSGVIWDTYIGMDGLCAAFGLALKVSGRVRKVVYWAMDFVPTQRFKSVWKNKIYHLVNTFGYKQADEMWDISPRMAKAREKYLKIPEASYNAHRVVPYGVWTDRIKRYDYADCERYTAVFMGHLIEKQGVQLIIAAMPELLKIIPEFRFKIIGAGAYKESLVALSRELRVDAHCDFMGKIEDILELESEVAKSCVAVAPYIKKLDTWTYYADPGKIKTYLACGVPVLLTDIPWNAREIVDNKCGKIISEERSEIVEGILEFMDSCHNQEYRRNAINYAKKFDYNSIFTDLL